MRLVFVVFTLLAGCGDAGSVADPGDVAGDETPLERVSDPVSLDVATWNLQDFPRSDGTVGFVAAAALEHDLEILVVEEVTEVAAFDALVAELVGWDGVVSETSSPMLSVGVLWDTAAVTRVGGAVRFDDDPVAFPRPVLRSDFEVVGADLTLVTLGVHLKAGIDPDDEARRATAVAALDAMVKDELPSDPVVMLGDFNTDPGDPGAEAVMAPLLAEGSGWTVPTWGLEAVSFLPFELMLDQVALRGGAAAALDGPARVLEVDLGRADYRDVVGDHRPVVVTLTWEP